MAPSVLVSQPQPAPEEPRRHVQASEAARMLGVTTDTIRRWVGLGLLPAERLGPGRRIWINPDDLGRLFSHGDAAPVRDQAELAGMIDGSLPAPGDTPAAPVPSPATEAVR